MEFRKIENSVEKLNNEYPDLFVDSNKRESKDYIKNTLDYFESVARRQYADNIKTFVKNYLFVKGELTAEDFYELPPEVDSFMQDLTKDDGLPADLQNYSIMTQPINTFIGEQSKQPDNFFVKAFDEYSQSEEFQFLTNTVTEYAVGKIQANISTKLQMQGMDPNSEDFFNAVQQMTEEEMNEKLSSYTSLAEKWSNRILETLKVELNLKEIKEESFSDLIKAGRPRIHLYEDNSPLGFAVEAVNPKNTWKVSVPDKKYLKDAYAAGIIEVLEISDIIDKYDLPKKLVDELLDYKKKNKSVTTSTGINSIAFGEQEDPFLHSIKDTPYEELYDDINQYLGLTTSHSGWYGSKYVVTTSYIKGKLRVGKLKYIDEDGITQVATVGDDYKSGDHPNEVDIEWGYVNQWFKGIKIGNLLYSYEPLEFVDKLPLIGGDYDNRNSPVKSFVDLMKPFQILYNVVMNQLYRLLQKEIGVVYRVNLRKIPVPKDGEYKDALDDWEAMAIEKGIVFEDDSPENMGTPGNNTNLSQAIDLTRTSEIQTRYTLAQQLKYECWELVGVNRERLGGVAASQTAQGTQAALSASFSATEPWVTYHNYIINDLYQLILDAAQYYESQKPESTISYISGEGEHAFVKVTGNQLKMRDLRVFVTNRSEDIEARQSMQGLAQAMMQNGVSAYEVSKMFTNKSIRVIQDVFKRVKNMQEDFQARQQDIEQQKVAAIQEQTQTTLQIEQVRIENENMNKAADRDSKERIAVINTYSRQDDNTVDSDGNGTPDIIDIMRDTREQERIQLTADNKLAELNAKGSADMLKNATQVDKLRFEKQKHQDLLRDKEEERKLKEKELQAQKYIAKTNKN